MAKTNYTEIKVAAARTALFNNIKDVIEEINIHDVLKLSSGENLPTHQMIEGKFPVFGGGGSTNLTHNVFNVDFETLAIGRVGARCGCVFKVPKQSWVTDNALYALSFDKRFNLDFLIHYLSYVDLNQYANRAAQPVISLKRISSINFPLIDEIRQKEFIEIIESVENGKTNFGEEYLELNKALKSVDSINQLQGELSHQLTQIENLNQAILQEAVQGKLVAQNTADEPATELLKRIKAEKEKLGKKEKPLPPIKPEEIPFEIPESWVWCRLGEMSINRDGERKPIAQSERNVRKKIYDYYGASGVIDKIDGYTHEGELLLIGEDGANLVARSTPIAFLAKGKFWVNNHAHVLDTVDRITLDYLSAYINSIDLKPYVTGGFQPKLSQGNLNIIPVPLPPLSEQKRIVAKIEKQLAKTKQLKEHIIANQQATEQLLKALLHQAFEVGEKE